MARDPRPPTALDAALSVVVVSFNTRDLLARCLDSIVATTPEAEIIVVDNGSTDGSRELMSARYPTARLICNQRNVGFAAATNQGTRVAQGDLTLWLNSDAWLTPGAIERLRRALDADARIGAVGPRLRNPDGSLQPSAQQFPTGLTHLVGVSELYRLPLVRRWLNGARRFGWDHDQPAEVDWLTGACLLVRRSCLAAVGLLDDGYFMYAEEMDWCYRANQAGWRIWFEPTAEVIHVGGASSTAARHRLVVVQYRSLERFCDRHYPWWQRSLIRLVTVSGAAVKLLMLSGLVATQGAAPRRLAHLRALREVLLRSASSGARRQDRKPAA